MSEATPEIDPNLTVQTVNDFYYVGHRPVPVPDVGRIKLTPFKGVGPAFDYTTKWTQLVFAEHKSSDVRRARAATNQDRPSNVPVTKIK